MKEWGLRWSWFVQDSRIRNMTRQGDKESRNQGTPPLLGIAAFGNFTSILAVKKSKSPKVRVREWENYRVHELKRLDIRGLTVRILSLIHFILL
jgi:hypothetical protein